MASNLLIAYPQLTVDGTYTSDGAADSSYPASNIITGARTNLAKRSAANTTWWHKFDLGSSQSITIDYLIVARANLLKAMGSKRVKLQASTNDVGYSDVCGVDSTFQSATLYGPRQEDAIFTADLANSSVGSLPFSGSYRYLKFWAAGEGTEPSTQWIFSKAYFGQWFDFGRDPIWGRILRKTTRTESARESAYVVQFSWLGITTTKLNEALSKFLGNREQPVFLYTASYTDPLLEHRCLHAIVADYDIQLLTDKCYSVRVTFEELI